MNTGNQSNSKSTALFAFLKNLQSSQTACGVGSQNIEGLLP
jgi:hypothetical protein